MSDSSSLPSNLDEDHDFKMTRTKTKIRNFIGFWLLGLCNNLTYVVMLSAAHDLLKPENYEKDEVANKLANSTTPTCNPTSTGIILIFDVIPSLVIKMFSPFFPIYFTITARVIAVIITSALSLIITAFSTSQWMTYTGVIFTSLSCGLGEPTFLAFTSIFRDPNSVSAWSSGTGGAGVIGALSYFALKQIGLSTRTTLLILLIFPFMVVVSFWIVIVHPTKDQISSKTCLMQEVSVIDKSLIFKRTLPFVIPFSLVYYFEYLINQGLYEFIYFRGTFLNQDQQYRWYGLCYQIGVVISRSSVNFIKIKALWSLPILQCLNLILFVLQVVLRIIPNIYFITLLIFYEGCIGGACYVNTFDQIYAKFDLKSRPFALQFTTMGDGIGISLSGFTSVLLRKYIFRNCAL